MDIQFSHLLKTLDLGVFILLNGSCIENIHKAAQIPFLTYKSSSLRMILGAVKELPEKIILKQTAMMVLFIIFTFFLRFISMPAGSIACINVSAFRIKSIEFRQQAFTCSNCFRVFCIGGHKDFFERGFAHIE